MNIDFIDFIDGWHLFFEAVYYWWIVVTNQDDKYGSYRCDMFHAINYGWDYEHNKPELYVPPKEIEELMELFKAKYGTQSKS